MWQLGWKMLLNIVSVMSEHVGSETTEVLLPIIVLCLLRAGSSLCGIYIHNVLC